MPTLFGIKNCDSVKKALRWLKDHHLDVQFHDFRQDGLKRQQVTHWVATLGWETLINKRSTSWKGLSESTKQSLNDETVVDIILDTPTLIKRPLLDHQDQFTLGFDPKKYAQLFSI